MFQACMAGIVFAKFTKPTMRAETILFSKNALITMRNSSFFLVCRIGDLRYFQLSQLYQKLFCIFHLSNLIDMENFSNFSD
jgi:potassium inwardly-rectifying channel subfamily J